MLKDYFADFRDYIGELEKRGKLHRWSRPVNKDTELMPLMRLQYRGIDDEQAASVSVRERARRQRQAIRHQSRHGSLRLVAAHRIAWDWAVMIRWIFTRSGATRWRICTSRAIVSERAGARRGLQRRAG